MSAAKEKSVTQIGTLGIVAGGGSLPQRLLAACDHRNLDVFIVGLEGQVDPSLLVGRNHMFARIGAIGQIIKAMRAHGICDLVLIGSVRRPTIAEIKPDIWTAKFFARTGFKAMGDNGLLKALKKDLEGEGFAIHGIQNFAADLICPEGPIGRCKPKKADEADIDHGIAICKEIGRLDIGQAVIVQEGIVLGVEGVEGTDELIRRCSAYRRKGRAPILVKLAKPDQDRDLDLPTIGPNTVNLCVQSGIGGIVVQAGNSLMLDSGEVADIADRHRIFVIGMDV